MLQIVRRKVDPLPGSTSATVFPSRLKQRRLEIAFLSLAATNLFVVSSVVMFYVLSHATS